MPKDKLRRFREFSEFNNCFDFPYDMKGKWNSAYFHNDHPIVLEIGCGKGEYTVALANEFPERNFIGLDLKSNRMWKGAGLALEQQLDNVAFIRATADKLPELFAPSEISEIWITFPDPFPKDRHMKHRLTSPGYLGRYRQILRPGGNIHFKTDSEALFNFTLETLEQMKIVPAEVDFDVHSNQQAHPHLTGIQTHYEKIFRQKGYPIKYARFHLN